MANVLGINISDLNADQIKIKLSEALAGKDQCFITTPNPEIILQSHKDEELFFILNQADLSIADGFGLKVAGLFYNEKIPRLTGADLSIDLLALAKESGKRVAVINWRGGLSNRSDIEKALSKKYPSLKTLVLDLSRFESTAGLSDLVINRLNVFSPDIIFCTFGSPYQEKALYHSLKKLPSVKLALGCGGAFDFITGKLSRAPLMFRKAGLEWLWRLMKQPSRIKRIINAVVVFSWKLIAAKFYTRFRYRPNVACLLYKKGDQGVKILIVERADAKNHWQLPQGGTDGESVEIAGARELREETNASSIVKKGVFKNIYSYNFPDTYELLRHKFDYKGQKQSLFIAEFIGNDLEIKVNYWDHASWKWVDADKLPNEVHPSRLSGAEMFLKKFKSINL